MCTATQISWNFLIIAAHCLYEVDEVPMIYRHHGLLTYGIGIDIYDVDVHDDYEYPYPYDDIALIRIDFFSYYVTPIWQQYNLQNSIVTAIQFNSTYDENYHQNLAKTSLHVVPNEVCANYYQHFPANFTRGIVTSQLCAEDRQQNWSLRQAYTDGPIIMRIPEHNISNPYLVGIFAVGINCKHCPPAVFTRLSEYRDWISSIVWPNMTQWKTANPLNEVK